MCDYFALRPVNRDTLAQHSSCVFTATSPNSTGSGAANGHNNTSRVISNSHSCSSNGSSKSSHWGGNNRSNNHTSGPVRSASSIFKSSRLSDQSRSRSRDQDSDTDPLLGLSVEPDFDSDTTEPDLSEELPKDPQEFCKAKTSKSMDGVADAPARRQCSQRSCKRNSPAPPVTQLSERESALLQKKYEEKVNHTKYELVAGFVVERGIIQAYTIYRVRLPFEVTERRRRIIQRYYSQGCQEVMLYVNKMEFEHYMPVSYRPLPSNSKTRQKKSRFKFFNLKR